MERYTLDYKTHDTEPPVRAEIISDATGNPVSLAGASVKFMLYVLDDDGVQTEIVNAAACIENPSTDGIVRYDWQRGDLENAGVYFGEFEVTWLGGNVTHFPRSSYIEINVEADLDDN